MGSKLKIIGHRGFASNYPENSLIGFEKAAQLGVDGVELDVHLTQDGEVVVHHDETINRMTTGSGFIQQMTLAELQAFPLRSRWRRRVYEEKIPTLAEVLSLLAAYPQVLINIELKTNLILYDELERKVLELVALHAPQSELIYSSFHLPTLIRLKKRQPDAQVAFITSRMLPHLADFAQTFDLASIHPRKNIYFAHEAAFAQLPSVRPWTVNSKRDMKRIFKSQATALITKYPERALRLREKLSE